MLATVARRIFCAGSALALGATPLRRQRGEPRMRDRAGDDLVLRDDHARADPGDAPQALRELARQPDAAVRGRIAGQPAFMHRDARPGDPLHIGHRRGAVEVRAVMQVLLDHAEHALRRRVAGHAGRDRRLRERLTIGVQRQPLLLDRDDDVQRAGRQLLRCGRLHARDQPALRVDAALLRRGARLRNHDRRRSRTTSAPAPDSTAAITRPGGEHRASAAGLYGHTETHVRNPRICRTRLSRDDADAIKSSRCRLSTLVARRGFAATCARYALSCRRNQPDERAMNAKLRELKDKNLTEP